MCVSECGQRHSAPEIPERMKRRREIRDGGKEGEQAEDAACIRYGVMIPRGCEKTLMGQRAGWKESGMEGFYVCSLAFKKDLNY